MLGGLLTFQQIAYFRVGEGGWFFNGLTMQREPRTPDPTLTDIDIKLDPARSVPTKRYNVGENFGYYQKALIGSDFFFEGPTTLRVSCLLDNPEYNLENAGTLIYDVGGPYVSPEIWEIGLFDAANIMVAYGTFPKETKDASKQIENIVRIVF
jgi:hypothetical protein